MAGAQPLPARGSGSSLAFMLRAFRYRNYRLYFGGQIVSLTGTWITMTATSWLVYRLTGSATLLGVVGFASQFPSLLLTPFAGLVVDRANRHRLLVVTQTLLMLQSFALAFLTLSGLVTIPWLIFLSVLQGLVNAFDLTARQSFVVALVEDKRDLGNAIALNSSMFNAARLVGPTVAGGIIAATSEGLCFLIDGVSYVAVIGSLLAMRVSNSARGSATPATPLRQLKEGWDYTIAHPTIRSIILLIGLVCLLGVPYTVLIPVFAASVLHGGPHTLGFLMTAVGGGALVGALWLAGRQGVDGLSRMLPASAGIFGAALVGFAFSRVLTLSLVTLFVAGFGLMVQVAASNTLLQTLVEDGKRGRVLSFFLMAYFGTTPIGSLAAGTLSDRYGPTVTVAAAGMSCVIAALWFSSRVRLADHEEWSRAGVPTP
jgi:MFS family permease